MWLRITDADGNSVERTIDSASVRLGRNPDGEVPVDPVLYRSVSWEHARIDRTGSNAVLTPLSRNKTLLNDDPIEAAMPLQVGDRIRLGYSGPTIEVIALADASTSSGKPGLRPPVPGPAEDYGATVWADSRHLGLLRSSLGSERFEVGAGGVIGRDKAHAQFVLEHPHVSRGHAGLRLDGGRLILADLGSANGTYLNGRRITAPVALNEGDRLDIGPFSLRLEGGALVSLSRSNNIELVARRLQRVVKDRATGKPLMLLHDVSLVVRPRELVCVLGPSGSGKSTLLAMLSGRNPPDRGSVAVNGEDLFANFAALKEDIAVVPQKDVLHDSLAVGTALRYTAELRLPPDTGREETERSIADILEVVGLTKRRHTLIRHLSGGQVKRASLANELIARPSLLFLDEVTSGLDEQTDREMMELFRQVAESGKTVICVTHALANVEAACHLVVILTEGGRLAFVGTPEEAKHYFGVPRLGDIYARLAEQPAEEWQKSFRGHALYGQYVRGRLAGSADAEEENQEHAGAQNHVAVDPRRQAWILMRRYISVWAGDLPALGTMLAQSLLVALLLGVVFGKLSGERDPFERALRTRNLMFLVAVACFWFGCNNAAKEIVKERTIYARERDCNLRLDSYFAAKFLVLAAIALVQVSLLSGIARLWCGMPGSAPWQWSGLAAVAAAGTALGLFISALARTEEVALALVPIAVMPQIILAGVIAPLTGVAKLIAKGLITVHWTQQALESLLPARERLSHGSGETPYGLSLAVVLAHAVAMSAATLLVLRRRDRAGQSR